MASIEEWTREAGQEPIPGYRLVEPLGRGGFGEVWKCEVPGGLYKAVKFVGAGTSEGGSNSSAATQELEALQRVKSIRHPFILSLDRVEVIDGVLVIIMELADKSLHALHVDTQGQGQAGLPRDELLGYLLEAAEALDWMNFGHGLQHLDVKPHNLFLVSNHVKVADFGLVHSLGEAASGGSPQRGGGVTPLYASPEILRGSLSRHSDQYSLAIVYQQLLTGTVPFWHQNPYQLMLLHLTAEPCLATLPPEDRPLIARALSKSPEQRFPSCLDLVQALLDGQEAAPAVSPQGSATRPGRPARNSGLYRRLASSRESGEKPTVSVRRPPGGVKGATAEAQPTVLVPPESPPGSTPGTPTDGPPPASSLAEPSSASNGSPGSGDESTGPGNAQPTCVSLPGYRFAQCLAQNPLGDVWRVIDDAGEERRALCLYNFVGPGSGDGSELIARLQGLEHPVLPRAQVSWSPSGRLVLITEPFTRTLRDRFDACLAEGLQGIPRGELLRCLRTVAEGLDALAQEQGVPHLGLNPRTILLQPLEGVRDQGSGEKEGGPGTSPRIPKPQPLTSPYQVRLAEFGLVPLVWLPTGQPAGQLNPRYAAPELFDRGDSPTSDQYSLAVIYTEMLSGVPPRQHRGPVNGPGSGLHRRPQRSEVRGKAQARIDLDLLPSADREIVARALSDDPRQRFASCTELIRALEACTMGTLSADDLYHNLPPVIPYTSLLGQPAAANILLPSVNEVVAALGPAAEPHTVSGPQKVRYKVLAGGVWEYQCPIHVLPAMLRLKLDGFREEWGARLVRADRRDAGPTEDDRFLFQIDLQTPRRVWNIQGGASGTAAPRLELLLLIQPPGPGGSVSEARVRLRPLSGSPDQVGRILADAGPRLFDSIRSYLQAGPEQRARDRWPCTLPLQVYPVLPDLELGAVLDAVGRNISYGGINFRAAQAPTTEKLYLHWPKVPRISTFVVLAQVVRVHQAGPHAFEVAASFPGDSPSPPPSETSDRAEDWR